MRNKKIKETLPEDEGRALLTKVLNTPGYQIILDSISVNIDQEEKTITFQPSTGRRHE